MAQICPAKSTIVPFKKQMYSSGSIILSYKDDKCICVSIHAPTRGATNLCLIISRLSLFQSTHPRGVRPARPMFFGAGTKVSIHAPTRGATLSRAAEAASYHVSIHAPTRGATNSFYWSYSAKKFQSTHPRGVRPIVALNDSVQKLFQSTHPRGVRHKNQLVRPRQAMFQSTHPRGVRRYDENGNITSYWFQSTHPRGVRQVS